MSSESPAVQSMAEKGTAPSIEMQNEAGQTTSLDPKPAEPVAVVRDPNWFTRNGLNADSFRMRNYGLGLVELDRSMKARHLSMIAIGGSIGAGFFVGSGNALHTGGPASLLIDFMIIGVMIFNVVYALGELAVMYPVSGSFYTYSARFIDPSWGFAMGWNYVFQWAVVLPLELTVCGITITYWDTSTSVGVWIALFLIAIIVVNIFGTLGYAEEEFWASVFKLCATVIFLVIAFVLVLGGGPAGSRYDHFVGSELWRQPGAFNDGFLGFCSVFVTAAFAFSGTELVGLAAAEARNPAKALPSAIKQIFWRITIFYVLGMLFVGLLIPYDDTNLISDDPLKARSANVSPFVLVGKYANLVGFDHFMNVVILVSVLSIGVSAVYGGSRCLTALAQQGYAPRIFTYIDRSGRPLPAVGALISFGLLAFVNLNTSGPEVFDWLLSLSGLAALFTWGSICLAHVRFRSAWKYHGHTVDEIPFQAIGGVWGSYLGLVLVALVLIAQFYTAIQPLDAKIFFQKYMAAPIVMAFWLGGYLWKRQGWLKTSRIDVESGRRELDWGQIRMYREQLARLPLWRRILHHFF